MWDGRLTQASLAHSSAATSKGAPAPVLTATDYSVLTNLRGGCICYQLHPAGEDTGPRSTFRCSVCRHGPWVGLTARWRSWTAPNKQTRADLPHWIQMLQDRKGTFWNPDQFSTQCSPEPPIRSKLRALRLSQAHPCHGAWSIFSRDFHTMRPLIEGGVWNIQWGYFCFSNTDTSDIRGQTWSVPAEKEKSA